MPGQFEACGLAYDNIRLASALPAGTSIVATDLNETMLGQAQQLGSARPVEWRQADALQLPFDDNSFDAVLCQFGVMFFPDKPKAFSEARRVLNPGGTYFFNVWDRISENEFADSLKTAWLHSSPRIRLAFSRAHPLAITITR